jgi:hypothetical protein
MLSQDLKNVMNFQKQRKQREIEARKKIFQTVKNKINNYARLGHTYCTMDVPPFLFGYSTYDKEQIINYIVDKIKEEGFLCELKPNGRIYISWDIKDIETVQKSKK